MREGSEERPKAGARGTERLASSGRARPDSAERKSGHAHIRNLLAEDRKSERPDI